MTKINQRKASLLYTATFAVAVLGYTSPVHAQNKDGADEGSSADIIVTARRVEERLQDVPISIAVFNQGQIDNRNITTGVDLAAYTPSLYAEQRFGSNNSTFAIRGFTQELRTTPSVGVYFAEVVAPRGGLTGFPNGEGSGAGAFFDLQNVQVMKGPQGTLFGRNTTGGAILLVPKEPADRFEGYIEGSIGNLDMRRIQAVLNLPVSDAVRLRFGVDRLKRDGYLKNVSGVGPDRFGDRDYFAGRASLAIDLAPNLKNYTVATYSRVHENGTLSTPTSCTNTFPFGILACQQLARQTGVGFYAVQNSLPNPISYSKQWQIINRTTYEASDSVTVRNIASYAEYKNLLRSDLFGTNWIIPTTFGPIPNTGPLAGSRVVFATSNPSPLNGVPATSSKLEPSADEWTATEELQVVGTGERLNWQLGGYLELARSKSPTGALSQVLLSCADPNEAQCVDALAPFLGLPALGNLTYLSTKDRFRNIGIYAQATYSITDSLKVAGGLRYTWDQVSAANRSTTVRFFQPNLPISVCSYPGVGPGPNVPISNPDQCLVKDTVRTSAPTWVIDLEYNPVEDLLLYAKYSRGYRQGSINPFVPPPLQTYDAEKVDTYEVGVKASFDGPVSGNFNAAAFYNDFTNQQLALGVLSSTNAATPTQATFNAGSSEIYGLEIDASLTPFKGFNISGGFAYLETKLKEVNVPSPPPGSPYDTIRPTSVAGGRLAFTPKYKASLNASYQIPIPNELGELTISGTYTYTGKILTLAIPLTELPSIKLVNANLNWESIGGYPIDISLFVLNVSKEKYYLSINNLTAQGFINQIPGEPRTFGLRLRYRFGND